MPNGLHRDRLLLLLIGLLWAVSLALPSLIAGGRSFTGYELLVDGWQGLSRGVYAWLANPLFVAALAAGWFGRDRVAAVGAAAGLVLGATSARVESVLSARMASVPEIELGVGYYLWMTALAALVLQSSLRAFTAYRHRR